VVPVGDDSILKTHPIDAPFKYLLLAFLLTWGFWIPIALDHFGLLPFALPEAVSSLAGLGTLGPALAAMLMVILRGRRKGIRTLLAQVGRWRVGLGWYGVVILVYPTICLLAGGLYNWFGGQPRLVPEPTSGGEWLTLIVALSITVMGEELGWRGYALPALQTRWNALWSSLILGAAWTLWHVPYWTIQPSFEQYGWSYMALNGLWILAASVFITWFMNNSGNSVLLAWLFHLSLNLLNVGYLQVTGTIGPYWILITFSWAITAVVLIAYGPQRLVRREAWSPQTTEDRIQTVDG